MGETVFTTRGWLPAAEVELRVSIVRDDADVRVQRTDKYLRASGEWVGNDLDVQVKRTQIEFGAATGSFS